MSQYTEEELKEILKSKLNDSSEIEHHLFEKCNLNCSFCGQDHDSEVGMESIVQKAIQTIQFIEKSDIDKHTVNVMGGEIFNDLIPDSVFDDYYKFYDMLRDYEKETGIEIHINFVTNLIFSKNIENVKKLMQYTDPSRVKISTSYDFAGRGLDINRTMIFKRNIELFKDRIGVIGFVLSKPSIRRFLEDKDNFFKNTLYPNFPLYFDWYVPEKSSDKMLPSEQEMLDALLFTARNYPNISPVKELLNNNKNTLTCYSLNKTTILPDGKEVKCRYMEYDSSSFVSDIDYSSNSNIIQSHIDRNGCLSCKWFERCSMRCFVQADWKSLERLPDCMMRMFFNEIIGEP